MKQKKSKITLKVLNKNCVASAAELNEEDQARDTLTIQSLVRTVFKRTVCRSQKKTGVMSYRTFLFTKPSEGLDLILFNPEILIFGCKISYNIDNEAGEQSKLKPKGMVQTKNLKTYHQASAEENPGRSPECNNVSTV